MKKYSCVQTRLIGETTVSRRRIHHVCVLFLYMCGFLSFQVSGISISREHRLKERSDAQTVMSRLLRIGTHKIEC